MRQPGLPYGDHRGWAPARGGTAASTSGGLMLRYLPFVIQIGLLVYALIDCIQTDSASVRNLDKTLWIFVVILIPIIGPIAWLVAGRPQSGPSTAVAWPSTATAGFPEYERPAPRRRAGDDLPAPGAPDPEKEWLLAQWQAQLEEKERRQRAADDDESRPA